MKAVFPARVLLPAALVLASALVSFFLPTPAQAQQYSIDWFAVAGGGGSSTGGIYSVSGTIGQHDAGRLTGGSYVLEGGFWGLIGVLQTPGAPLLSIERVGTGLRVFWPSSSTGYLLDETTTVGGASTPWNQVASGYQTNSAQISITINSPTGTKYYRLRKP